MLNGELKVNETKKKMYIHVIHIYIYIYEPIYIKHLDSFHLQYSVIHCLLYLRLRCEEVGETPTPIEHLCFSHCQRFSLTFEGYDQQCSVVSWGLHHRQALGRVYRKSSLTKLCMKLNLNNGGM